MSVANDLAVELRSLLSPRPDTTVTEGAEANVYLPSIVTQKASQYLPRLSDLAGHRAESFQAPVMRQDRRMKGGQVVSRPAIFPTILAWDAQAVA